MSKKTKGQVMPLLWLDPRTKKYLPAGVAFFNPKYGEYLLKINEEASEKRYFLKPFAMEKDRVVYRMELVLKNKNGSFLRRQFVGEGTSKAQSYANVYINYGSKYKKLVLISKKEKESDTINE